MVNWIKRYKGIMALFIVACIVVGVIEFKGINDNMVNSIVVSVLLIFAFIMLVYYLFQIFKTSKQDKTRGDVLDELEKMLGYLDKNSITGKGFYQNEVDKFSSQSYEHYRLSYNILAFAQKQKTGRLEYVIKHKQTLGDAVKQTLKSLIGFATAIGSVFALINLSITGDFQKLIGALCILGATVALVLFTSINQYNGSDEKFYRDIMNDILSRDGDVKTIKVPARNQTRENDSQNNETPTSGENN